MLLEHMHKKFEMNRTKIIKGVCQLGRKVVPHDSKSDLPLVYGVRWGILFLECKYLPKLFSLLIYLGVFTNPSRFYALS